MKKEIKLPTFKCTRCGHKWHPKKEEVPLRCAKCKTPYWNKPKVIKNKPLTSDHPSDILEYQ